MSGFRDWLDTVFGSDGGRAVQMLFALLIVVLLILAVTWLFRRLFGTTLARGRSSRLSVVDTAVVDGHRRLLLVRRDEVEHLVMIGGPNDLLVESRILKAPPVLAGRSAAARPQPARPVAPPPPAAEPVPAVEEPALAAAPTKSRAAAGAAGMVAAVASAGALLRSRVARSEPKPSEPVDLDATEASRPALDAVESSRRTLDEAFDTPLGRPAPAAPRPPVREPAPPPVAVEAPKPIDRPFFDPPVRKEPEIEPAPPIEPVEPPSPMIRPTSRNLEEIDLLADFEAITAELTGKPAAAPVAATPVGAVEPVEAPRLDEIPASVAAAPSMPAVAPAPVVVEEPRSVEPRIEPIVEPKFDFDFTAFGSREPEPGPEPIRVELEAPEPIDVAPPVEIADPHAEPFAEPSPDAVIAPPSEPIAAPPPPAAPVDELEEEMARLLAELSGQTRR